MKRGAAVDTPKQAADALPLESTRGDAAAALALFLACAALAAWFSAGGWNNTLLDVHGFRQTQTAIAARSIARDGFRLDYAMPVLGAPWSVPFEFPTCQWAAAALSNTAGLPLDSAGRAVSLAFFCLSLPAIWLLLRDCGVARTSRWLFLALVVTTPVYLVYSRAFLIESTAFFFSAWFLSFFRRALVGNAAWIVAAAATGAAAGVTKVTTFAVFLVPALGFIFHGWKSAAQPVRTLARAAAAIVPGVIAASWWLDHSDRIKEHNVFGASMTSAQLHTWVFGAPGLRFGSDYWRQMAALVERAVLPLPTLLVLVALLLLGFCRHSWKTLAALLLVGFAGPLVFANLYIVHDYYYYASGVLMLLPLALPLRDLMEASNLPRWRRFGTVAIVLVSQLSGYLGTYRAAQLHAAPQPPPITTAIRTVTHDDDVLIGVGMNWSPVIPYYADRRAIMVPDAFAGDSQAIEKAIASLGGPLPTILVAARDGRDERWKPLIERLDMDPTPLFATGEINAYLRKDRMPDALRALGRNPVTGVLLYEGTLGKPGEAPRILHWGDKVQDQSVFSSLHPRPTKVSTPFGISLEKIGSQVVFNAHVTTEIEMPIPPGAHRITAGFGINPAVYGRSDGVRFEVIHVLPGGGRRLLYSRFVQPSVLASDQGEQSLTLEPADAAFAGSVVFRTSAGPAGNASYDWSYWSRIEIR